MIAAAVVANWPVLSVSTLEAITENNLARALEVNGRLDEAIAHYERATTLDQDYAPSYNNLATALRARGDLDRAIARLPATNGRWRCSPATPTSTTTSATL
jgi:tetratricopeptide (TPR) repeat protein